MHMLLEKCDEKEEAFRMKRYGAIACALLVCTVLVMGLPLWVLAAPKESEVDAYLKEIGWTRQDLANYLEFYEVSLEDFKDMEHLRSELGTPINKDNLHEMLVTYDLTKEELEILLSRFGEKIQDYTFLEDLEIAVDFYMTHDAEVARAEDFLVSMGFDEGEARLIFHHILSLPKDVLAKELEKLQVVLEEKPNSVEKVFSLWNDLMEIFQVDADLHVEDGGKMKVSSEQLLQPGWIEGKEVHLDLYNEDGALLASAVMDEQIVSPVYAKETGAELVHLGQVGVKYSNQLYHHRMPDTASMYGVGMLVGVCVMLGACVMLFGGRVVGRKESRIG
jgi:processed acidic surface protein